MPLRDVSYRVRLCKQVELTMEKAPSLENSKGQRERDGTQRR